MPDLPPNEVTALLREVADGSGTAHDRLAELVYAELRTMAERQLRGMSGHTLQPTALVHEAWLKLTGNLTDLGSRNHFLCVAAKTMRSVLVDHARRKRAEKRGGNAQRLPLDAAVMFLESNEVDLLDLDAALSELERDDPDLLRWVEMRFFSGMTNAEIAAVEGCSESTIERGWRLARARLHQRLRGQEGG